MIIEIYNSSVASWENVVVYMSQAGNTANTRWM